MVKHIVMWNLAETAEGNAAADNGARIKKELEALVGVIPGLNHLEVNFNFTDGGYDLCLYSEFEDKASLAGYADHPAHVLVKTFVHKVVTGRVCADYEI